MDARLVLKGCVVTMDPARSVIRDGAVYVAGNAIAAVQERAAPPPTGFEHATSHETGGVIVPGMIELHNHLSYNILGLWNVPKAFTDRDQWQQHVSYIQNVNGPMLKLAQSTDPRVLAAIARFAETRCLLAGVTSSQGISLKSDQLQKYYQGALRVVEDPNDRAFHGAATHISDVAARDWQKFNGTLRKTSCLLLHLSEGLDRQALDHFKALRDPVSGSWAISPALAGIHCAALGDDEFQVMGAHGGAMVWSPLSNLMLYGGTARVDLARAHGVPIALGSDWSPSGSKNLLHELKVAQVANAVQGYGFSDADLLAMVTSEAARIVKWDRLVGSLEPGKRADLVVIRANTGQDPYGAVIASTESDVQLVMIDGAGVTATAAYQALLGTRAQRLEVGGVARFVDYGVPDPDIVPISYADTLAVLTAALAALPAIPSAPKGPALRADQRPARQWQLALDEQCDSGHALRPLLPLDGHPTGARIAEIALHAAAVPVGPVPLDRVCVPDDPDYAHKLDGQRNIPAAIKAGLRHWYPL